MQLNGNHYSAKSDRFGSIAITRKSDLKTVYLQGDEATEVEDNHRILDAIDYPSGPFKVVCQWIDTGSHTVSKN